VTVGSRDSGAPGRTLPESVWLLLQCTAEALERHVWCTPCCAPRTRGHIPRPIPRAVDVLHDGGFQKLGQLAALPAKLAHCPENAPCIRRTQAACLPVVLARDRDEPQREHQAALCCVRESREELAAAARKQRRLWVDEPPFVVPAQLAMLHVQLHRLGALVWQPQ
jgi:hypothetical protein